MVCMTLTNIRVCCSGCALCLPQLMSSACRRLTACRRLSVGPGFHLQGSLVLCPLILHDHVAASCSFIPPSIWFVLGLTMLVGMFSVNLPSRILVSVFCASMHPIVTQLMIFSLTNLTLWWTLHPRPFCVVTSTQFLTVLWIVLAPH